MSSTARTDSPRRPFEDAAYPPGPWPQSFWRHSVPEVAEFAPLEGALEVDLLVVGGGYTGLNAALAARENGAGSVALIDAAQPGWGASGRNGGFCCLGGSALSLAQQIKTFGPEATRDYIGHQRQAIEHVEGLLARYEIDVDRHSEGELQLAHKPRLYNSLLEEAEALRELTGIEYTPIPREDLSKHGMGGPGFFGGVITKCGFALNPLKYAQGLVKAASSAGVHLFGNTEMMRLSSDRTGVTVTTAQGEIRARKVILATNAYANDSVPAGLAARQMPAISAIMVTRPLSQHELEAQGWTSDLMAYDSRHLLHYFRKLPNNRFLIGQRGALFVNEAAEARSREKSRRDFETMFPAWRHVETEFFWSGFVCLTRDLTQYIGPVPGETHCLTAFGYHGNGVGMASYSGRLVAEMALGKTPELPEQMTRLPRRFPLGRHRRWLLQAAFCKYWLEDRIGR